MRKFFLHSKMLVHIRMRLRLLIAISIQNSVDYETKFEYYEDGSVKMEYKIFKRAKR
jgi:hypothetical protein